MCEIQKENLEVLFLGGIKITKYISPNTSSDAQVLNGEEEWFNTLKVVGAVTSTTAGIASKPRYSGRRRRRRKKEEDEE